MKREDTEKWVDYYERGIKPTRYKLSSLVFSDHSISTPAYFQLNGHELTLIPLPEDYQSSGNIEGFSPAFMCDVISESEFHKGGNNFNIHECLDRVLPLVGFNYRLPLDFLQYEEYEGVWIQAPSGSINASIMIGHKNLPKDNIVNIVNAYEIVSLRTDKRSKKASALRSRIKEALELEGVSIRYSFLSYYSIIEIISDDLASTNNFPSENPIAIDIAYHSLSTKGSQRTKLYFLLNALQYDFNLNKCIKIADIRNDIAHGEQVIDREHFELCKELAFWASEIFVLFIAENA